MTQQFVRAVHKRSRIPDRRKEDVLADLPFERRSTNESSHPWTRKLDIQNIKTVARQRVANRLRRFVIDMKTLVLGVTLNELSRESNPRRDASIGRHHRKPRGGQLHELANIV